MSMRFNAQYILDFLTALTAEQVTIRLQNPLSPALFADKDPLTHRARKRFAR